MVRALIHGTLLALGLILPLGPRNVFVFTRGAMQPHLLRALPVVLVASLPDTLLILLAVLGASVVMLTLPWVRTGPVAFGLAFLVYIGWVTWRSDPKAGWPGHEAS